MAARETALNALIACRKNGAWSNGVLKEYCARDGLDARDAALAARLCYGVLQNRNKLDFIGPQTVPENCVFVMGDNRNASTDSRDKRIGMVDVRLIIGRAYCVIYPTNEIGWIS